MREKVVGNRAGWGGGGGRVGVLVGREGDGWEEK